MPADSEHAMSSEQREAGRRWVVQCLASAAAECGFEVEIVGWQTTTEDFKRSTETLVVASQAKRTSLCVPAEDLENVAADLGVQQTIAGAVQQFADYIAFLI
ncbi:MAG: hypothetical protein ACM3NQ_16030 [Bacteroidales bacterium]